MENKARRSGILLPVSSLPGKYGVGDFGASARDFIDFVAGSGLKIWQILPLVQPGAGNSPYSSSSSFLLADFYLDLDYLLDQGFLTKKDTRSSLEKNKVDFARVIRQKRRKFEIASKVFFSLSDSDPRKEAFKSFKENNPEIVKACIYASLKEKFDLKSWVHWPAEYREPGNNIESRLSDSDKLLLDNKCLLQHWLWISWSGIMNYSLSKGVKILGDIPFYVDHDSSDVWWNQQLFDLNEKGRPNHVSGVPPDYFSRDGQLWGNPIYRWDLMKQNNYDFWKKRLLFQFELCHTLRLDHFRAFSAYWQVSSEDIRAQRSQRPGKAPHARNGSWVNGPGNDFFAKMNEAFDVKEKIVIEDLGDIDQPVIDLKNSIQCPGMLILQFAFNGDENNIYLPQNHSEGSLVYTGTHDNDTVKGWWKKLKKHDREHVLSKLDVDAKNVHWQLIEEAFKSRAETAIVPIQDFLGQGSGSRINVPGKRKGNWRYKIKAADLQDKLSLRILDLVRKYDR